MEELDPNLHIPLYRQVESILEDKIVSGEWEKGYRIPSEQELAQQFQVSNITVKRAVMELVQKGLIYRQRGKGSFVSNTPKEQDILQFITITTKDEAHPHQLLSFTVDAAGPAISKYLQVPQDEEVIKIKRLKVEDGEPESLEYTYIPSRICPGLSASEIENELIYNLLKDKYNIPLAQAKLSLKPYIADEEDAKILGVNQGHTLFEWRRTTFSENSEIVEFSKFQIRSDKEFYSIDIPLSSS